MFAWALPLLTSSGTSARSRRLRHQLRRTAAEWGRGFELDVGRVGTVFGGLMRTKRNNSGLCWLIDSLASWLLRRMLGSCSLPQVYAKYKTLHHGERVSPPGELAINARLFGAYPRP